MPAARSARKNDDQRRDGHDPGLAAHDREREAVLAVLRQGVEVEALELALGGAGARRLGQQGDQQRQHAVDVMQVVGRLVSEQQQDRAEQRTGATTATWATRSAYQKPTRRLGARNQAIAPRRAGDEVGRQDGDPDDQVDGRPSAGASKQTSPGIPLVKVGFSACLMRKITM